MHLFSFLYFLQNKMDECLFIAFGWFSFVSTKHICTQPHKTKQETKIEKISKWCSLQLFSGLDRKQVGLKSMRKLRPHFSFHFTLLTHIFLYCEIDMYADRLVMMTKVTPIAILFKFGNYKLIIRFLRGKNVQYFHESVFLYLYICVCQSKCF